MKQFKEVNKALLKVVQDKMDTLYVQTKKMLEMDGPSPAIEQSMENLVNSQSAFDLIVDEVISRHKEDGNLCPVILATVFTELYMNSLELEVGEDEKVTLGSGIEGAVKSLTKMASNPLAMYVWDRHVKETLEKEMKEA